MDKNSVAKALAGGMIDSGAVLFSPGEPFTWASGWLSPVYIDSRKVLSVPWLRNLVKEALSQTVRTLYPQAEVIAGVATGAIAHGALVADALGLPMVYVRPKPKDHGTRSQIEGILPEGACTVVVEDMVSTGKSSLAAVEALRASGAEVLGMTALFTYGFPLAEERFSSAGVPLSTLSTYGAVVEAALERGLLTPSDQETLLQWRRSPQTWK